MNLLLDTHALVWAVSAPARLPTRTRAHVRDPENSVMVSAVSTWEISIKAALGKIDVDVREMASALQESGFSELPVRVAHTVRLHGLPRHHRDPFDRLLVAQSIEEGLTIVTRDPAFRAYGVPLLWG